MTAQDLRALRLLDQALDDLAADRPVVTDAAVAPLVVAATGLRAAVPAPPAGAADRGRAALLAAAAGGRPPRLGPPLLRASALAAALLLVAVPAFATQRALPGTALWPLRSAGQQVRTAFAGDAIERARIRFDTAAGLLDAARAARPEQAARLASAGRAEAAAGLAELRGRAGAAPEAERVRGQWLLDTFDAVGRPAVGLAPEPADDPGQAGAGAEVREASSSPGRPGAGQGRSGSGASRGSGRADHRAGRPEAPAAGSSVGRRARGGRGRSCAAGADRCGGAGRRGRRHTHEPAAGATDQPAAGAGQRLGPTDGGREGRHRFSPRHSPRHGKGSRPHGRHHRHRAA